MSIYILFGKGIHITTNHFNILENKFFQYVLFTQNMVIYTFLLINFLIQPLYFY